MIFWNLFLWKIRHLWTWEKKRKDHLFRYLLQFSLDLDFIKNTYLNIIYLFNTYLNIIYSFEQKFLYD